MGGVKLDDISKEAAKNLTGKAIAASVSNSRLIDLVKWPKGKYNGQRIDGFKLSFHLHILWWHWKPILKLNYGEPYFIWLCFSIRGYLSFAT